MQKNIYPPSVHQHRRLYNTSNHSGKTPKPFPLQGDGRFVAFQWDFLRENLAFEPHLATAYKKKMRILKNQ